MLLLTLAMISGVVFSSLVEYLLHRYYRHSSHESPHVKKHHMNFRGDESFEQKNVKIGEVMSRPHYILTNIVFYLPVGLIFTYFNYESGLLFMATAIAYTFWIELAHLYYHKPDNEGIKLEKYVFFSRMKEHHRTHHAELVNNFGIASSLWDWLLDTKKE